MARVFGKFVELSIGGIDYNNTEMGGEECYNIMTPNMRILSSLACLFATLLPLVTLKGEVRSNFVFTKEQEDNYFSATRLTLLVVSCLIFGVQLGLKFMHRIAIFLLCPCHVQLFSWIYLLAAKPSQFHSRVRELVVNVGFGPAVAILFPTDDWLVLPFEWEIFWIQHIFITAMPFISIWLDHDIYNDHQKRIFDWDWMKVSYFAWMMWLSPFCHLLSVLTLANIGHSLCTAYTDPFRGPYYIYAVIVHQAICIVVHVIGIRVIARGIHALRKLVK